MIPAEIEAVALIGWHVYPCSRASKAAAFKGAHLHATADLNQLARWSKEYPNCNWRVVFGPSGIWGLDVDSAGSTHAADGIASLQSLIAKHGPLPAKPMTRSGGGGYGIFFAHKGEKVIGKTSHPLPGIDPRRGMQSITIPPSIHIATKRPYRWLTRPWEVSAPVAPGWLLKLVEPPPEPVYKANPIDTTDQARRRLYRAVMAVIDAGEGTRNDTLNRRAFQVGKLIASGLLCKQEAVDALYAAGRQIGLDHGEVQATLNSALNSGRRAHAR